MPVYRDLAAAAGNALTQADRFYAEASAFPERFRGVLRDYLEAPDQMLKSRHIGEGPAWEWPFLTEPFTGADLDPDCYITFAISITLDLTPTGLPWGSTLIITPAFRFKPIRGGFEVIVLERKADGLLADTDRFEIRDDTGWEPPLRRCIERWREMLSFSPYDAVDRSYRIGFDTVRPAKVSD